MVEIQPTTQGALRANAAFVRLLTAGGASAIGARVTREGLPLMAVLALHASPDEVGVLAALRAAPALFVGPLCGAWVDRLEKRRILIAADLARAMVLLAAPAAAITHHLSMALVCLIGAAIGGLSCLFEMANHAFLPTLVEPGELVAANAALGATESVAEIGGPAVAGILFTLLSAQLAVAFNSATYLVSALLLAPIRGPGQRTSARGERSATTIDRPAFAPLTAFAATWASRDVRCLLLLVVTSGLFGSFFAALYIPFALHALGLTPAILGATIATGGVGALLGAAVATPLQRRLGVGPALLASGLAYAATTALIPLAPANPVGGTAMLMAAQLLGDAAGTALFIYVASLRQTLSPQANLGRTAGVFAAAGGLAAVAGALAGGPLAESVGCRTAMAVACAGMALAPLWWLASASPWRREMPHALVT